ncbi:hypothetical protein A3F28_00340 [Candidatus Uhrbacteria bacterium RIFCSPHIGHO2_12_FULL_57_11]|uniref:Response regulatory domain-containing protein n=1 Tax=Candidatus Uhrbacteria bacterium RIFCSPHIGHO2_12_FULL_57_11 TaxID=1802398 RepID=A0A1F7UKN9_9BACT|nr:MAG: hypothetical protein A3F28_00340 [Candidatus Uhrbacteria bacterium RIFCSPHIGHO2_12_FULL_57_11]
MPNNKSNNKPRILIVEDNLTLLNLIKEKVKSEGWTALTAVDGDEAAKKIWTQKPDLILLDLLLPKRDGVSVLREMRSRKETADIPVVVLTNLSDGETVEAVMAEGGTDFLVKTDYTLDDVMARVRQRLPIKKA